MDDCNLADCAPVTYVSQLLCLLGDDDNYTRVDSS
jgi:hypothetical protein